MIIAGTGHSPERAGKEDEARARIHNKLKPLKKEIDYVITGMSAGFDLWFADEALKLRIPVVVARPWEGHPSPVGDEVLYATILEKAKSIYCIDMGLFQKNEDVFRRRDKWMVDNCTHLLAYYDGVVDDGGTSHTYWYAKNETDVKVANMWGDPPF